MPPVDLVTRSNAVHVVPVLARDAVPVLDVLALLARLDALDLAAARLAAGLSDLRAHVAQVTDL